MADGKEVFLSFLPLSHTFERTVGYYLPIMVGAIVAHSRSIQDLADDLIQIRPEGLISVPRIFERVYAKVKDNLAKQYKYIHVRSSAASMRLTVCHNIIHPANLNRIS